MLLPAQEKATRFLRPVSNPSDKFDYIIAPILRNIVTDLDLGQGLM